MSRFNIKYYADIGKGEQLIFSFHYAQVDLHGALYLLSKDIENKECDLVNPWFRDLKKTGVRIEINEITHVPVPTGFDFAGCV